MDYYSKAVRNNWWRAGFGAGLIVLFALFAIVSGIWFDTTQEPKWNQAVHGHIVNAYWSNSPELMIENLQKAKDGMRSLGLSEQDYGTVLPWQKTPDNSMAFQYKYLDSVIGRAQDVITWREEASHNPGTQTTDIYEQKMGNLREFISPNEGGTWGDDVGEAAWDTKNYPVLNWLFSWVVLVPYFFVAIGLIAWAIARGIWLDENQWDYNRERARRNQADD